jgi:hypothetical protein
MTPAQAREILTRHLEALTGEAVHLRQGDPPRRGIEEEVGTFVPTDDGEVDDRRTIEDIRAALVRLDLGTWGACASCAEPIDAERLTRAPYTRFCAGCSAAAGQAG